MSFRESGPLPVVCYVAYARDGEGYARRLKRALVKFGATVLDDSDLAAGESWVTALRDRLARADVAILIGTAGALESPWVISETEFCRAQAVPVLPIALGGRLPLSLLDRQWIIEEEGAVLNEPSPRTLVRLRSALTHIAQDHATRSQKRARARARPQVRDKRPLNEGKLILVGRGEVGKTSLVRRLVEHRFDGDEAKTQGIRITSWSLPSDRDRLRLNVWDFGGQEMMHATHQFFLTERSLYLLVLNGRNGGEDVDAEYWLTHIRSFGGESPVIVVQNKFSEHPFELNYRGLQARYPQIRGFVKTDCRDELGIGDLRAHIEAAVGSMPELRMAFPADWFAVKERLEAMEDEYLGHQQFVDLCAQHGLTEDGDREAFGVVLHCLGIALNYRDDPRLRETSVLKPEWVTHGIYAILNARKVAERQGELRLDELVDILPKDRYPREKHLFLIELMRKFSLCFPFQDRADRYLVPELLGKEEPEAVAAFRPEECLNFEFHYSVMPEGLLPRFIVRTHALSRERPRWRTGVVLAFEDCTALVKAEPADRKVVVRVRGGDASGRRRLLAIVRSDLENIHLDFKDRLDARARVPLPGSPAHPVDYEKLVAFEKQQIEVFPEWVDGRVVQVRVKDLLSGIDLEEQRADTAELFRSRAVFFSYSHKDEALRDELETHLKLLQRQRVVSTWHDRKIPPGDEWGGVIDDRLERAPIVLLLVSSDFIASNYCWDIEVKRAMERHERGEAIVVPILLRTCDLKGAPFAKLQGLPRDLKAVTAWSDRDAAWTDVAKGIRSIAERAPRACAVS